MRKLTIFIISFLFFCACSTITYTSEDEIYFNEYDLDSDGFRIDYIKEYDNFYYIIAGREYFKNDISIYRIVSPKNYDEDTIKACPKIKVGKYYNLKLNIFPDYIRAGHYIPHEEDVDLYGKKLHVPLNYQKDGCVPWISIASNLRGLYLINNEPDTLDKSIRNWWNTKKDE